MSHRSSRCLVIAALTLVGVLWSGNVVLLKIIHRGVMPTIGMTVLIAFLPRAGVFTSKVKIGGLPALASR